MVALLLSLLAPAVLAAPPEPPPDARFDLSLWCDPRCDEAALERFDRSLTSVPLAEELPDAATAPTRVAGLAPAAEYGRPDASLAVALPGELDAAGVAVLARSEVVVVTGFAASTTQVLPLLRQVYGAFATLARETGGVVEEVGTGRYFSAAAFLSHAEAVATDPLDTTLLFVVETEEDPDGTSQLSTWGLRALGLPEFQVASVAEDRLDDVTTLLNTLAQVAFERGSLAETTPLLETTPALPAARRRAVGIAGTATASAVSPRDDPGHSPVARVAFEGRFDVPPPSTSTEAAPPGEDASEDTAAPAAPPATLEEARAQAAERFHGRVRAAFSAGLPPGDRLFVKAPFEAAQGRTEYLWIAVGTWEGGTIEGTLHSEPAWVQHLASGDAVRIHESDVFDWLLRRTDGTTEGNATEPFLHLGP